MINLAFLEIFELNLKINSFVLLSCVLYIPDVFFKLNLIISFPSQFAFFSVRLEFCSSFLPIYSFVSIDKIGYSINNGKHSYCLRGVTSNMLIWFQIYKMSILTYGYFMV